MWWEILLAVYLFIGALIVIECKRSDSEGDRLTVSTAVVLFVGWIPVLFLGFVALVWWGIVGD